MSKFFRGAVSSSSESESDVSNVEVEAPPITRIRPLGRPVAYPSDSEDEGHKRIIRTQKDKTYGDLKEMIRTSRNAKSNKDISKLLSVFKDHIKAWEKAKVVAARENLGVPRFYVRYLAELEDYANEQWEDKEGRKTMSKQNSKALSALRQKVKKYNTDFEEQLESYRQEPDALGYSSGAAEDDEPDVEAPKAEKISTKNHVEVDGKLKGKRSKYTGAESESESSE